MGIQGRESTIQQVLTAYRVAVPLHQRPYSWELSELRELWQDLISFYEKYRNNISGRQYFIGSIVGQIKEGGRTLEVLDGQQRLATLVVMLAVARDVLHEGGAVEQANRIDHSCITDLPISLDGPREYRIQLGRYDDQFFKKWVLSYPSERRGKAVPKTASQRALLKAQNFFRLQIENYASESKLDKSEICRVLYSVVVNNVTVVQVVADKWDDVTEVFERLNDRGKDLSTLDLLRVHLIGKLNRSEHAEAEDAWRVIYELSDSAPKVDTFLRHSYITYMGDVKSHSLFRKIKNTLEQDDAEPPFDSPLSLTQSLAADAEYYKNVLEATHPDESCTHWLRAINTLGAKSLLPAALSAQVVLVDDHVQHAEVLRRLVTTFVRWNVIQGGESTDLEEAVYRVAQLVRSRQSLSVVSDNLRPYLGEDALIRSRFEQLSLARSGYQRYVLEALEDYSQGALAGQRPEKTVAGSKTLWIEHVYPQAPEATWGKWVDHDEWINRLGNLTLIHKRLNNVAKNKPFPAKKPIYSESSLGINKYFSRVQAWSPGVVDKRQSVLAKNVAKIWPRF
ncbi:Uncharacterised protein [Amycolatopsis camponoti]|uniref:DUF262 domain-containing protein n=1 Tax=Amycolatopsis camponoti TaxID=2606593 RepID=A0A6I8LKY7_9PSEU|nr:DUF262 domain-containing protein [Amycolatopsis camponoti]VVJ18354.1 Uncharacterised protein [Amycolatopsis camponoti]